jgi:Raf kinase inhibitor-like YbhB/YbcL family protein
MAEIFPILRAMRGALLVPALFSLGLSACGGKEGSMSIPVASTAFESGRPIPAKYTGEGADVSPPLTWTGVPAAAKELALICDDPDAPTAEPWVHWVLYKLPPSLSGLKEGDRGGGLEGKTDNDKPGYGGPMPPKGDGAHHYHFTLYALDQAIPANAGITKSQLLSLMQGHILARGELVGTYERK